MWWIYELIMLAVISGKRNVYGIRLSVCLSVCLLKRSDMDHTVLQITPCLPFLCKRSPDGATPNWGSSHPIAAYYTFIDPEWMKGWVGLVCWPIADGLHT